MKIGIPRSLLYYYYYPFWQTLFKELGMELILSEANSGDLLNQGAKEAVPEICVPMKVYVGQVLNLLEKGVELIYIPRFVSIRKGITFCPKFLGLPDMLMNSLSGLDGKILTHEIRSRTDDISAYRNYALFRELFQVSKSKLSRALKAARRDWLEFRKLQQEGYKTEKLLQGEKEKRAEGSLKIGVLAYVYNLYDRYINMDFLERLEEKGVKLVSFEMLDEDLINKFIAKLRKPFFWEFTNKLMAAGHYFINSAEIDGIIHLTAFACGPDAILGPFLDLEAQGKNKPFMTLRIDEQTGESHFLTRIEAFVDLLSLKKRSDQT
ncbi:MAG TPA: hypothetical protein GXZ20_01465 [Halanaerobiaceae bacterium]|nr:acyl-CoA dehydratase activase-related protein [Bacillota bacterium]HHU91789.1 hypothetical protein [Halanaerobiaceae bacterium]HOA40351.1 acyl-CoA dehydratase activase-related protein [Halanaerobiales bacterium]HPZ62850.1 acyl-CoA dehydratase activase-related protein [Halanaerobiales bacterium]HQD04249.1 acyl-CoA dehydratase activase-related protein [Halanaerobiales bacterium]